MDLNGDGQVDILSGSYSRTGAGSMAGLFQVLWGKADGSFKTAAALKGTDDKPLIIPIPDEDRAKLTQKICTRPTAVHWDADGKLDLVVGNFAGSFYVFKGKGEGNFEPLPEPIKVGEKPLMISGVHSDPFVVDWDGDGDIDLLSGSSSGGVQWAENHAGKGKTPVFKSFETLIAPGKAIAYGQPVSEDELKGPTRSTRIWVDDVNEDGRLDILVGDNIRLVTPAKGLSKEEFKKKYAEWQEAVNEASSESRSPTANAVERQEAQKRLRDLYAKRAELVQQQSTGFVWLYVRK